MTNVITVDTSGSITEINPPAVPLLDISLIQPIIEIEVTAPGGFGGGLGIETFPFTRNVLYVSTGGTPVELDGDYEWVSYTVSCGTAPTGSAIIFDINKNDVSLFTNQANRPTIPAGTKDGTTIAPDILTFQAGDKITIDTDQIGSLYAGANASIVLRLRRKS